MRIDILSAEMANRFVPQVPTIGMRIWSLERQWNNKYGVLKRSNNWLGVFDYTFDDLDNMTVEETNRYSNSQEDEHLQFAYFNSGLADKILDDFLSLKDSAKGLMVHCRLGQSRSAGVAIALNDIFSLGQEVLQMKINNPLYNKTVYAVIMDSALRKGLVS